MTKKWFFPLLAVAIIVVAFFVVTGFSKDESVATFGDEKITKEELYKTLVEAYGQEALTVMIEDKIIALEVKKAKVTVSDEEIDEEFLSYIEKAGGEEAFASALEKNGRTKEQFKEGIVQYLSIRKVLEPRIKVTDKEIKTYFDKNKETLNEEEQVEASHILVEDEATAETVSKKLADGEDFATLAKEYSTDKANAEKGGELGYFGRGKMAAEFEAAAFSMDSGAVSAPIKTEHGYHIIKVTDKKAAKEAVYEDQKESIKEILVEEKVNTEYTSWLDEVKEDYNIENSLLGK